MRKTLQKGAAIAMASTLVFAFGQSAGAAAIKESIPAWASAELGLWQQSGLLKGDRNGLVRPNETVTKAEFLAFVNRVFNYQAKSGKAFGDVSASAWYADEIAKAHAAGILQGNAQGNAAPLATLTREEAAVILSRVFDVAQVAAPAQKFADDEAISSWASSAVYGMKEAGYAQGASGSFQPKKGLTRAEAVKMINNVMGTLIADASSHASVTGGNAVVNTAGGTLQGAKISGNLYITPGVGEGDFTIENSEIGGTLYLLGGGEHSIFFKNSKAKKIKIVKPAGALRLVLGSGSSVEGIQALTSSTIVNESSNPIGSLDILGGVSDFFNITGGVALLALDSPSSLNALSSIIGTLTFSGQAQGGKAKLDGKSKVGKAVLNSGVSVTGDGTVDEAEINAEGASFEKAPGKWTLKAKSATIAGKTVTGNSVAGGGGGGGGSSGSGPVDMSTKIYTREQVLSLFPETGAAGDAKQFVRFLEDSTYDPSKANTVVGATLPPFVNSTTFVNAEFDVKPSLFPALRGVNTSVLDGNRKYLWIGTDAGVTKIDLATNETAEYTAENKQLADNKTLLLISDGGTGVYAVTKDGVSYIRQ